MTTKKPRDYVEIGRKGGLIVAARHGPEHFARIGEKGAKSLLEKKGRAWFAELGRRSAAAQGRQLKEPDAML